MQKLIKFESKGQLSLEYLLLTGVMLSLLLFFFPLALKVVALGSFAEDTGNASAFFHFFSSAIDSLNVYGVSSKQTIQGYPLSEWVMEVKDNTFIIELKNSDYSVQKKFEQHFDLPLQDFKKTLSKKFELTMEKTESKIEFDFKT